MTVQNRYTQTLSNNRLSIDRAALSANYQYVDRLVGPRTEVAAVVKSDGYGHGLETAARAFFDAGCRTFCVGSVFEGGVVKTLFGEEARVLKMTPSLPAEFEQVSELGLEETVVSWEQARQWEEWLGKSGKSQKVHLKLDVGMGRLGFAPEELWTRFAQALDSSFLEIVGLMGHLPASEEEGAGRNHASPSEDEIERFRIVVEELETYFGRKFEKHLANSGGALFHSSSHFDLARVGLALYGVDPRGEDGKLRGLAASLSCESKTIQIRTARPGMTLGYGRKFEVKEPMTVGIAPIGYAEGIPRSASSKMEVLVQGQRCKVLGNVSMSLITFDVSKISSPQVGDKVTIIGTQCDERIGVEDLARWAGVLPYEILTGIGRLVGRREVV